MAVALASRSQRGSRQSFLDRRARVFKATQERVLAARTPVLAKAVAKAFRDLRDSAFSESKGLKANLPVHYSEPDYDAFEHALTQILTKEYINIGNMSLAGVRTHLDITLAFELNERLIPKGVIARKITGISDVARRQVNNLIRQGIDDGLHPSVIGKNLRQTMTDWADLTKSRAYTIARTETAFAYNLGAIAGYEQSRLVSYVRVLDGSGCGWLTHNDPDTANGKVVTLDEARAHPIAHPNCLRAFAPVTSTEIPEKPAVPSAEDDLYANPKNFTGFSGSGRSPMEIWAEQILKGAGASVTEDMRLALSAYQGSGYRSMNAHLRGVQLMQLPTDASGLKKLADLEAYIALGATPDAVNVYRGVGSGRKYRARAGSTPEGLTDWDSIVGETFDERGFMSTALTSDRSFGGVQLELTVPKGYPSMNVSYGATDPGLHPSAAMIEAELLLQHGARYVIESVEVRAGPYASQKVTLKGRILPR